MIWERKCAVNATVKHALNVMGVRTVELAIVKIK